MVGTGCGVQLAGEPAGSARARSPRSEPVAPDWSSADRTVPLAANPRFESDEDNYYQLLGVPYAATSAEITRAYRGEMKRVHPDRHRGDHRAAAEERAKRLNLAYATLSKPLQRQAYDRAIRAQIVQDQIMGRYVGGFHVPQTDGPDPLARDLRRAPTAAERRARKQAERDAMVSIVVVFGGVTVGVVALLLLWAVARSIAGAVF